MGRLAYASSSPKTAKGPGVPDASVVYDDCSVSKLAERVALVRAWLHSTYNSSSDGPVATLFSSHFFSSLSDLSKTKFNKKSIFKITLLEHTSTYNKLITKLYLTLSNVG